MLYPISTYSINLVKRVDRKTHCIQQFNNKPEFNLQIKNGIENENGALGLWLTIKDIIGNLVSKEEPYILICEDDHLFTEHYNKAALFETIKEAGERSADVLMGGVSWFNDALQISKNLFWVDQFTGTQFVVVYQRFFDSILQADFLIGDTADRKIATLSKNKFIMFPFISTQKEFGYSDATTKNNNVGYVGQIFNDTSEKLNHLVKVASFYQLEL